MSKPNNSNSKLPGKHFTNITLHLELERSYTGY